jgi:hypothetical protein
VSSSLGSPAPDNEEASDKSSGKAKDDPGFSLEAEVEPFEGDVDGDVARQALATGREVEVSDYSPARTRETMRVALGATIIAAAMAAGAAGAISAAADGSGTDTILTGVFSPLLGLAGAVVGFYFGGKDSST